MMPTSAARAAPRYNRVPRVTPDFWIIKLLAVTVGETAADYLAVNLGLGLSLTSWIMVGVLAVALILQFAQKRYVPWAYWLAVVMISIVGTLVSDNLVDTFDVKLRTTTILFGAILAATFWTWYRTEGTLSIHTIFTTRREAFYWLAILFTFALGTSAGDWVAEGIGLGYVQTGLIFAAIIGVIGIAYFLGLANGILAFWLAYIFTRPVGASFGDLLSQPIEYGGMGFGTIGTSLMFLCAIATVVLYMTATHRGQEPAQDAQG
jgi:uncharacterized membrane-anchored protein